MTRVFRFTADRFSRLPLAALATGAAVMTAGGCYQNVVGVKGLGAAEKYPTVHQRAQDDVALGKWFGESADDRKRERREY